MPINEFLSEAVSCESAEDPTDNFPYPKIPREQMLKVSDVEAINDQMDKQLLKMDKQDLDDHIFRLKKEIHETQNQLKLANELCAFEAANLSSKPFSSSQSVTPVLSALTKVSDLNVMFEVDAKVPDVPLSPELSPLVEGMSIGDECERTITSSEHDLARRLRNISLNDEEFTSKIPSTMSEKDDMLSWNFATKYMPKEIKVNEFRKSQFSSYSQPTDRTFKASLYKTEICHTWKEQGHCEYGEKCTFAHGLRELRKRPA